MHRPHDLLDVLPTFCPNHGFVPLPPIKLLALLLPFWLRVGYAADHRPHTPSTTLFR